MNKGMIALALLCVLAMTGISAATPLNLTLGLPDVTSGFLSVGYSTATHQLTAGGYAFSLEINGVGGPDYSISAGSFSLSATVDQAGGLNGGTFSIGGTISGIGATTGTLLMGNISSFGFANAPGGEIFEFTATVTGGDLAALYGPSTGIILDAYDSGFNGTFLGSFANTGFGVSDTAPVVPEPATLLLALIGGIGLAARRRRH